MFLSFIRGTAQNLLTGLKGELTKDLSDCVVSTMKKRFLASNSFKENHIIA